jgi:hypothetical protein
MLFLFLHFIFLYRLDDFLAFPNSAQVTSQECFLFIADFSMASMENNTPSKDVAQQLLKYLDILYPNGVSINTVINVERNTAPEYKDEVNMFFQIVAVYAADYNYDAVATYKMAYNDNMIAMANWTEVKQMLTCLSRVERVSLYNNARAIESGRI